MVEDKKKKYSTYAVMFYINKSKVKKNGMTTIMGRISVNGEMTQFSTKIDIAPDDWCAKTYRAKGKGQEVGSINYQLEQLSNTISSHHKELTKKQSYVTAELLKNMILGIGIKPTTLLTLLKEHIEDCDKMIGVNLKSVSVKVYKDSYTLLSEFLKLKMDRDDILLKELKPVFIEEFDYFLRIHKGYSPNTVRKIIIIPKKMGRLAVEQGTLQFNPFIEFLPERPPKQHRHMSEKDFGKLVSTPIECPITRYTRDMFVFSTFTGVSYVDMQNLTEENIRVIDGALWIIFNRQKTGTECHIRLLPIAREILEKYKLERKDGKLFNMVRYGKMDIFLKKAAKLCGISKNITYHMSRHNFATIISLSNGVPIETVGKMMGHTEIRTTQVYARITNKKLNEDMKKLSKSLSVNLTIHYDENINRYKSKQTI